MMEMKKKKKKNNKFHRIGYKKTRTQPKRKSMECHDNSPSDSDYSSSDAPTKKKKGKNNKKQKSEEYTSEEHTNILKDPFAPIKQKLRVDLSSTSKIREFITNIPTMQINLWQCIDLGKRNLHKLTDEEVLDMQEAAFKPYHEKIYDKTGNTYEFTDIEVVNLHGLSDLRTPITDVG